MTNREYLARMSNDELAGYICRYFLGDCKLCGEYLKKKCYFEDNVIQKWLEAEHIEDENTK